MKYTIYVSGNLGKKAKLYLINGNDMSSYETKRKLRINAKFLLSDLYLEYYGNKINRIGLLRIFLSTLHKSATQYPKMFWHYFFYRYEFNVEVKSTSHDHHQLSFKNQKDIWYSRLAQLSGFYGDQIGFLNDINKFRFGTVNRIFILEIKNLDNRISYLDKKIQEHLEQHKISKKIAIEQSKSGDSNLIEIFNAYTSSPYFVQSENRIFLSRNLDIQLKSGWPTDRLFSGSENFSSIQYPLNAFFEKGVMSTFSSNWYHFLVETLPLLIKYQDKLIGIPYLYFDACNSQIINIIRQLLNSEPIQLPSKRNIHISSLFYIQDFRFKSHFDFAERKADIELLRSYFQHEKIPMGNLLGRNILLIRDDSLFRKTINQIELRENMLEKGFELVEPSKLSFDDQKRLFSDTRVLVSETGAGLANMLFMPKHSKVIELKFGNFGEQLWKDFATANQIRYHFYQMHVSRISGKALVNIKDFNELLQTIL
jgi:hypothetical protein